MYGRADDVVADDWCRVSEQIVLSNQDGQDQQGCFATLRTGNVDQHRRFERKTLHAPIDRPNTRAVLP
jgi:hypothetical protein